MREKTITEVMRNPIFSYSVTGYFDGEEQSEPFDSEAEAVDAAKMMESGGATEVTVERRITRVVEDVETIDWRTFR